MRKVIMLIFVLVSLNSLAQKKSEKKAIMIPIIENKNEKLDLSIFNEDKSRYDIEINENFIIYTKADIGYGQVIYSNNSYFKIVKAYYSSKTSNIKKKGILFNNGSQYGIWYEFDEEGNLVKEINTDEGYEFGWQEIIAYCEKKEIELTKGYEKGGYQTEILKQEENGKKVWVISYLVSPVLICKETLDGVTGKLLNSEELEFINH